MVCRPAATPLAAANNNDAHASQTLIKNDGRPTALLVDDTFMLFFMNPLLVINFALARILNAPDPSATPGNETPDAKAVRACKACSKIEKSP
jgi:hypothetical protein